MDRKRMTGLLRSLSLMVRGRNEEGKRDERIKKIVRRLTNKTEKKKRRADYKTKAIPPCRTLLPYANASAFVEKRIQKGWGQKIKWETRLCVVRENLLYLYRDREGESADHETELHDLSTLNFHSRLQTTSKDGENKKSRFLFASRDGQERLCIRPLKTTDYLTLSEVFGQSCFSSAKGSVPEFLWYPSPSEDSIFTRIEDLESQGKEKPKTDSELEDERSGKGDSCKFVATNPKEKESQKDVDRDTSDAKTKTGNETKEGVDESLEWSKLNAFWAHQAGVSVPPPRPLHDLFSFYDSETKNRDKEGSTSMPDLRAGDSETKFSIGQVGTEWFSAAEEDENSEDIGTLTKWEKYDSESCESSGSDNWSISEFLPTQKASTETVNGEKVVELGPGETAVVQMVLADTSRNSLDWVDEIESPDARTFVARLVERNGDDVASSPIPAKQESPRFLERRPSFFT